MCTQFHEQLALSMTRDLCVPCHLDVNHHGLLSMSLTFQVRQLAFVHRGIKRHQQNAMVWSERSIDKSRDFFLAQ